MFVWVSVACGIDSLACYCNCHCMYPETPKKCGIRCKIFKGIWKFVVILKPLCNGLWSAWNHLLSLNVRVGGEPETIYRALEGTGVARWWHVEISARWKQISVLPSGGILKLADLPDGGKSDLPGGGSLPLWLNGWWWARNHLYSLCDWNAFVAESPMWLEVPLWLCVHGSFVLVGAGGLQNTWLGLRCFFFLSRRGLAFFANSNVRKANWRVC